MDQHQFRGPSICNQLVDMSLELESLAFRNSDQEIQLTDQWTSERNVLGHYLASDSGHISSNLKFIIRVSVKLISFVF